jgi:hypothetical protein
MNFPDPDERKQMVAFLDSRGPLRKGGCDEGRDGPLLPVTERRIICNKVILAVTGVTCSRPGTV